MKVVLNASPIIFLLKLNKLGLINKLFEKVFIPHAVIKEILDIDLTGIEYTQINIENVTAVKGLLGRLHIGEVEVMIGAIENNIEMVVLDDKYARNKAKQLGLKVTGTAGLLLRAYKLGLVITLEDELRKLQQAGAYISDEVIEVILMEFTN